MTHSKKGAVTGHQTRPRSLKKTFFAYGPRLVNANWWWKASSATHLEAAAHWKSGGQHPGSLILTFCKFFFRCNCAGAQRRRLLFRNWTSKRTSVRPSVRPSVRGHVRAKTPNGICVCGSARYHSGYFSVDFQGVEKKCVLRMKEWFGWTLKTTTFFEFWIKQIVPSYARPRKRRRNPCPAGPI